ncbi:MAG: TonB-dependent receptor [Bacteroidetes bacterium]|nr:MAG: TonB-dependent receptor [Bacteroidota bacterium]
MRRLILLFATLLISASSLMAQRVISGTVTDGSTGDPIQGVSVLIKGTTIGIFTDSRGKFALDVPTGSDVLVFSFAGKQRQELTIGNQTVVSVTLDDIQLEEVVVVGYGTLQKKNLTGSLSSVKGSEIETLPTPSFEQQLAGRAAGVQVTTPSGVLGQAPRVRIRGTNSISSGASPLYVVDGVPINTGDYSSATAQNALSDINPADIESIEVLKDGSATAIYGSRAANGVVLITTKRGRNDGQVRVSYDGIFGVNQAASRLDLLNADEFILIANEKYTNAGQQPQAFAGPNNVNTDWQDIIFQNGAVQNHNVSITGGGEKNNYFFSAGYSDQNGALVANKLRRYSFRSNVDQTVNKYIKFGFGLAFTRTQTDGLNTGSNALSGNLVGAARLLPNVRALDPANTFYDGYNVSTNGAALGQDNNLRLIDNNFTNLGFVLANNINRATSHRVLGNSYGELNIIEGLKLRTQIGTDVLLSEDFLSWDPRHGDGRGSNGFAYNQSVSAFLWNWQNTINYDRLIADAHNINIVAGLEYQSVINKSFYGQGQNFSDRFFIQNNLIDGSFASQFSGGSYTPTGFDSYFGRVNYGYKGRYLLSFSARNDGISSLPEANRRGTFLGGSIGYRISEEEFFKNSSALSFISELKVRGSYAQVGNTDIGAFPYLGTFGAAQYGTLNGIAFANTGNPDLRWESSTKIDIGLDLGFFDNRLNVILDYFVNDIDDLVLNAPTAPSLGVPNNTITRNIGSMTNRGFEATVDADVIRTTDFKWNVNANFTWLDNEVTALVKNTSGVDQDIILTYNIVRVGEQLGAFYGFEWAGVNPANGNPMWRKGDGTIVQYNVATGATGGRYYLYNAETPEVLGAASTLSATADRKVLGNSLPKFQGGFGTSLAWKGLSVQAFLRYSVGNLVMNVTRQATLLNTGFQNNGAEILDRWTPENTDATVPKVFANGSEAAINNTGSAVDRFLEPGDFLRMQNLIVSYNFPQSIMEKTGSLNVRTLRIFAQMQNPFIITKYKGLDPELNSALGNTAFGIDDNANPIIRTSSFGVSLGF